jgi:hypothetical protein
MDQNLPLVERAEIGGLRVAQLDHAKEFVVHRSVTERVFENCSAA